MTRNSKLPDVNTGPIRLLLIEDNQADARLLQEMLTDARGPEFEIGWINQLQAALDRLALGRIDVVLLDLALPDSEGLETFTRVNAAAQEIPIVVLTGRKDEEMAIKALAEGAQDYLVKGAIDTELLVRALQYAIERKQAEAAQRERSEHLERLNKALHLQRKKLLEQTDHLTRANEELKRLSNAKSEFVTAVSHDLRTPLTTIVEGISLTEDETLGPINAEQRKYLRFALEEAERLTSLLNQILDISKIEAGRVVANRVKLDVRSQILRIVNSYEAYARDKTLDLSFRISEDIPHVLCDPEHYDRVLTNLLSNAIKFNRPGGWITVRASRGPEDTVVTTVADSGIGIPKSQRSRIFGPFERVARPGTYRETGSGLGLALSRQLVALNDGTINFDTQVLRGGMGWGVGRGYLVWGGGF